MPRAARRDCRKSETKKNAMVHRVEAQQRAIKKERKGGAAVAAAPPAADAPVSEAAASFLSQMRGEVAAKLSETRQATATAAATQLKATAKPPNTS